MSYRKSQNSEGTKSFVIDPFYINYCARSGGGPARSGSEYNRIAALKSGYVPFDLPDYCETEFEEFIFTRYD
jgi:hypothetical protein